MKRLLIVLLLTTVIFIPVAAEAQPDPESEYVQRDIKAAYCPNCGTYNLVMHPAGYTQWYVNAISNCRHHTHGYDYTKYRYYYSNPYVKCSYCGYDGGEVPAWTEWDIFCEGYD